MDEAFVVAEFLRRYMDDRRAGEIKPLVEYQAPFPGHEDTIAAEFRALESDDASIGENEGLGGAPDGDLRAIGRYRILREIGRGGQGTVYLAEDPALGRKVALKVLSRLGAAADTTFARFEREALVASRLNHPGICKVYESGQEGALAYIAMEFVEGETLASRVARQRDEAGVPEPKRDRGTSTRRHASKESVREVLEIGERAARALHAAHEAGVIHRDIKPGNILITEGNQPVILDFGLARATGGDFRTLTRTGDFFGTPAYMSPEQVSTKGGQPDRRTDVYSLAATLYECLTLRPPFGPADPDSLYHRILTETAPRPSRLNRSVPHDLDVVLEKAMDKESRRRYATALDLAEELARVRRFEPIRARAPGPAVRLRRWSQRNPVAAAFLLLLTLGLAGAFLLLNQVRIERDRVRIEQAATQRELRHARALGLVGKSIVALETDGTLALLLAREAVRTEERPETVSQLQTAVAKAFAVARIEHGDVVRWAEFSPDGTRLVTASDDGMAKVWCRDGDVWRTGPVLTHASTLTAACFFPQGDAILTACRDGSATVWDSTGARLATLEASPAPWRGWRQAWVGPEGNRILTVAPRVAKLWVRRGSNWELERELPSRRGLNWNGSFAHDGSRVVIFEGHHALDRGGDWAPRAVIRNIRGEPCAELRGHTRTIRTAVFSPDDRLVLTTSRDSTARVWDVVDGKLLATLRHGAQVLSGCFFPDGDHVVTASFDGTVRIWDLCGSLVSDCAAYEPVRHVAVSPDGSRILACTQGNRARVFDRTGHEIALLIGHRYTVLSGAFSPTGDHLVTTSGDHTAIVWKVDWRDYPVLCGHPSAITVMRFLQQDEILMTHAMDGTVRYWDLAGAQLRDVKPEPPTGRYRVAKDSNPKTVRVTDAQGQLVKSFEHDAEVRKTVLSPDETRLVTIAENGERFTVWDIEGPSASPGAGRDVTNTTARFRDAAFSPDSRRILTAASDGTLQVWDVHGNPLFDIPSPYVIHRCRFSPDGRLAVSASHDGAVLWDLESRRVVAVLRAQAGSVTDAIFSPKGDKILTASSDGTVRTWPVRTADLLDAANRRAYRDFTPAERERFAELLRE